MEYMEREKFGNELTEIEAERNLDKEGLIGDRGHNGHQTNSEEIARLAHSLWEARGRRDDSAIEDWLEAEREYSKRHTSVGSNE